MDKRGNGLAIEILVKTDARKDIQNFKMYPRILMGGLQYLVSGKPKTACCIKSSDMSSLQEFALNFDGKPVPQALAQLLEFQHETGFEEYAEGFGLLRDDKSGLEHGWSTEPAFLDKLMPFAQANGSGSFYALWQHNDSTDLNELPVVVFGDEGGEFVVAENIKGLLQLLTIDAEPMIFEDVTFYKDPEEDEGSAYAEEYRTWLKDNFSLEPVDDADLILGPAQEKHQAAFDTWKQQYFG